MEPIVYNLIVNDNVNKTSQKIDIETDKYPSPALIKYGYSNISRQMDFANLTSNEYYRIGLDFDFENTHQNSISSRGADTFGIDANVFDQTFAEIWEIVCLFKLFNTNQKIYTPNAKLFPTIEAVNNAYQKLSKGTYKVSIDEKNPTLVFHKISMINVDESTALKIILEELPNLIQKQSIGSNMILQLFDVQTIPTAELIYYLSTLYTGAYLLKPLIVSSLDSTKYLILMNLKQKVNIVIPKLPDDMYYHHLIREEIPDNHDNVIQCFNSAVLPSKYIKYNVIKSYLKSGVYDGAGYQSLLDKQHENVNRWISLFSDLSQSEKLLDTILQKRTNECHNYSTLSNMYNTISN